MESRDRETEADAAIGRYVAASNQHAEAVDDEIRLEDARPLVKQAAIQRIMQEGNPLTGKPHSASSAEAVVETDPEYARYRDDQRAAVRAKLRSYGEMTAARLTVELLTACIHASAGVSHD